MHIVKRLSTMFDTEPSGSPKAHIEFFPLPFKDYITIYNEQSVPSNCYDYFNDVIFDIKKVLAENGIRIVQFLNSPSEKRLNGCHCVDKFTPPQMNYLIKNSKLHICTDSYTNEVCGVFDIPSICLAGNRYPVNALPFYKRSVPHKTLVAYSLKKPSYAFSENPKSINKIHTEDVSNMIFDILELDVGVAYKTLFVGSKYHEDTICDIIPNVPIDGAGLSNFTNIIRLDKIHHEGNCVKFCLANPFSLVVDKKISPSFARVARKNCKGILFLIDKDSKPEDVSFLLNNGFSVELKYKKNTYDKDLALKFLDFGRIGIREEETKSLKRNTLHDRIFRSSKIILSGGKGYPSYAHLEKDIQIGIINKVINSKLFWSDDDRYKIIEEIT